MWGLAFIIPTLLAAGAEVGAIWEDDREWEVPLLTPLEATINFMNEHGTSGLDRTREFAMLLRAGAIIPRGTDLPPYLDAVAKAGGYERYERAHRSRLAAIFIPKFPRVPAEIIPTIVAFWADCGGH